MGDHAQEFEINTTANSENTTSEYLPEESMDFTLLRLDNTENPIATTRCHSPRATCGCNGCSIPATTNISSINKRRSPNFNASNLDPQDQIHKKPKKLFLDPQEDTGTILSLSGFSKIALPVAISPFVSQSGSPNRAPTTNSVPLLRRCHSDPYNPPKAGSNYFSGSGMVSASNLSPQSPPESSKIVGATAETTPASKATASLPPRAPILRRSVSDSSPNKSCSRSLSFNDSTVDESPRNQWMKKMRDSMKEMNQLLDEVVHDTEMCKEEEEDKGNGENNSEQDGETADCEKAFSVEKTGECCVVQIRCQCAKAYQILFSDKDCYYKLL